MATLTFTRGDESSGVGPGQAHDGRRGGRGPGDVSGGSGGTNSPCNGGGTSRGPGAGRRDNPAAGGGSRGVPQPPPRHVAGTSGGQQRRRRAGGPENDAAEWQVPRASRAAPKGPAQRTTPRGNRRVTFASDPLAHTPVKRGGSAKNASIEGGGNLGRPLYATRTAMTTKRRRRRRRQRRQRRHNSSRATGQTTGRRHRGSKRHRHPPPPTGRHDRLSGDADALRSGAWEVQARRRRQRSRQDLVRLRRRETGADPLGRMA